jgi:hypothetical protein
MFHNILMGTEGVVSSRLLCDLIVLRDITYIPSTNRQAHRSLIDTIYMDATEQAAAVEIFDDQLKVLDESGSAPRHCINNSTGNSRRSANSSGSAERSDTSQIVESRAAHNICMRFCKPESKYTGKTGPRYSVPERVCQQLPYCRRRLGIDASATPSLLSRHLWRRVTPLL